MLKTMIQIKRTVLQLSTEATKFYSKELSKLIRVFQSGLLVSHTRIKSKALQRGIIHIS